MRRQTAREIASALTYLHSLDILHGDLSGGNILLGSSNKDVRGFVAKARPRLRSKRPAVPGYVGAVAARRLPAGQLIWETHGCRVPSAACRHQRAGPVTDRRVAFCRWRTSG